MKSFDFRMEVTLMRINAILKVIASIIIFLIIVSIKAK